MNIAIKRILMTGLLAGTAALSGVAAAHDFGGSLKSKATATDIWRITCEPGTEYLEAEVADAKPVKPPLIQLTVEKNGQSASTVDPVDSDVVRRGVYRYSPAVIVNGGDGYYMLKVDKLPSGPRKLPKTLKFAELYNIEVHCYGGGEHLGTDATQKCPGCKNE